MRIQSPTLIRLALLTTVALALTLAMTRATAGAATPAKPTIRSVHVKATAAGERSVTVLTTGRRFQVVEVCDLKATVCAQAQRTSRGRWIAVLPSTSRNNPIGVIARSGGDYVFAG
jgi:hypothetical protein